MYKNFENLIKKTRLKGKKEICVAVAEDEAVLKAIKKAEELDLIIPKLFGDEKKINEISKIIELNNYEVINCKDDEESVHEAVRYTSKSTDRILMKGFVNTSIFMRGILDKKNGLMDNRLLSLLAVYELKEYHKLLYCTDSGINTAPNLKQKKEILINAVHIMKDMGFERIKIVALTANEMVNPKIPATVDAKALVDFVKNKEMRECIIEGPIAFDVAFSKKSAEHKKIDSKIAGDVDLIVFPNIETGNALGKSWLHFNKAKWAGIVLGAKNPIILGSRSDTPEIKINSIAIACSII